MAEEKVWNPLDLVKVTAEYFAGKGVPNPRLDAEILLVNTLGLGRRVDLYAGFEREISGGELAAFREFVRRRAMREPVSRILGERGFMGLMFKVTPDVLSPRPETELLVEAAIEAVAPKVMSEPAVADDASPEEPETAGAGDDAKLAAELEKLLDNYSEDADDDAEESAPAPAATTRPAPGSGAAARVSPGAARPSKPAGRAKQSAPQVPARRIRVLDLGTGSGCIAIAVAAGLPGAAVTAVDLSPAALAVAKENATRAGVAARIDFRSGDWFAACRAGERFDLILSNPPYLVKGDPGIWPEVCRYDPPLALYGGDDGLEAYRRIVPAAPEWLEPGGLVLLEAGAGQAGAVADLLRRCGFVEVAVVKDYGGVDRMVRGKRGR